jgi:hypothetical protein
LTIVNNVPGTTGCTSITTTTDNGSATTVDCDGSLRTNILTQNVFETSASGSDINIGLRGTTCEPTITQWNNVNGVWEFAPPPGETVVTAGSNGMFPTVSAAIAASPCAPYIRVVDTNLTGDTVASLNAAIATITTAGIVIYIDPGKSWQPNLSDSLDLGGRSLTLRGNGPNSVVDLATFGTLGITSIINASSVTIYEITLQTQGAVVDPSIVTRIHNVTVNCPAVGTSFIGTALGTPIVDTLLANVVVNGTIGPVITGTGAGAGQGLQINGAWFRGTIAGTGILVAGPNMQLNNIFVTSQLDITASAGIMITGLYVESASSTCNLTVGDNSVLNNMSITSLTTSGTNIVVSNVICSAGAVVDSTTSSQINNFKAQTLTISNSSVLQCSHLIVAGAVTVTNTTQIWLTDVVCTALAGDYVAGGVVVVDQHYLDTVRVTGNVVISCSWTNSKIDGLLLTTASTFALLELTTNLDVASSDLGVFTVPVITPTGPLNSNFHNLNVQSMFANSLSGLTNCHFANVTSAGAITLGGQNPATGNSFQGMRCTTFVFNNTGQFGDWNFSNIKATTSFTVSGNTRNCTFSNINTVTMSLGGLNNTFTGLQVINDGLLTISGIDSLFTNINASGSLTLSGNFNVLTNIVFGQNNTSPLFLVTGNSNSIGNVNSSDATNGAGISFIMRGSGNSLHDFMTAGTQANAQQQFVVTGANNTLSNIQLGELNVIPITAMSNAASSITVTGDYIGGNQNRLFVGQYLTVTGTGTTNDGTYRITALAGATVATVTPAPPNTLGAVGNVAFPDVVRPIPAGSGVNNARPFGTIGSSSVVANEQVGLVTLGGTNNHYTNFSIIPLSWFNTGVVLPLDRPRGVLIQITSQMSHYTNLTIYKDQYRFSGTIPSPPAPNNPVVFTINVSNVVITGDHNRFDSCRIGPWAQSSGSPGFGTFSCSGVNNSILNSLNMFTPIGAFAGVNWAQNSYQGTDTGSGTAIGLNTLY